MNRSDQIRAKFKALQEARLNQLTKEIGVFDQLDYLELLDAATEWAFQQCSKIFNVSEKTISAALKNGF